MGASPLSRLIDNKVKSPLSRRVLFGDLINGGNVHITLVDNDLVFDITERVRPLTKQERKALKRGIPLSVEIDAENAEA